MDWINWINLDFPFGFVAGGFRGMAVSLLGCDLPGVGLVVSTVIAMVGVLYYNGWHFR